MIIDCHAHFFPRHLAGEGLPDLVIDDVETGRIMRGTQTFRPVRRTCWDVATRIEDLDAAGVDVQVISPVPVTFGYMAGTASAATFLGQQNDAIAEAVRSSGGRLAGLGAVPLQDVDAAIAEMSRATAELGLAGLEIGAHIGDRELDDAALRPFFAAAEADRVPLFIHPVDGGAIRRGGLLYEWGIGMLADTAMAATALVYGGVLDDHPDLRIVLAHGCGAMPWVHPRQRFMAGFMGTPAERADALLRTLWVDTMVFDPEHLRLLMTRFGAEHLLLGTDHPFLPGHLTGAQDVLRDANGRGICTDAELTGILGGNATEFFGLHIPLEATR